MTKLHWKSLIVAFAVILGVVLIYPTVYWYQLPAHEQDKRESMKDPIMSRILNLGLDLRGGLHLVLELQTDKIPVETVEGEKAAITDAAERVIQTIRNRVDSTGVAEPLIARQGDKWVVVQLPGVKDPERAIKIIEETALLEFSLVHDGPEMENIVTKIRELELSVSSAASHPEILPKEVLSLFPTGYVLKNGREGRVWLVKEQAELTGASLTDAKVQLGGGSGMGYPEVSLKFNPEGSKSFSKITGENINRNLAIILDGIVQSAPTIRSRIPNGEAVIEGGFSTDEAKFISTVLRAGALPVPLTIIEQRTVGPTLGEDSIRAGVFSVIVGLILVLVFMAIYYRGAGIVADFALILNLFFIIALMSYFQATLTLPGIAGIILSLGMAVDANILILERTREEILAGKTVRMAIDMGYAKAFSAIIDSYFTTFFTAICLFQFTTGSPKGFAVTLMIGLSVSMFTAIFATRVYYDWRLRSRDFKKVSI